MGKAIGNTLATHVLIVVILHRFSWLQPPQEILFKEFVFLLLQKTIITNQLLGRLLTPGRRLACSLSSSLRELYWAAGALAEKQRVEVGAIVDLERDRSAFKRWTMGFEMLSKFSNHFQV